MDQEMKTHVESVRDVTLAALAEQKTEWKRHYDELKADGVESKAARELVERAIKRLDAVEALLNQPVGQGNTYSDRTVGRTFVEADGVKEFIGRLQANDGKSGIARHYNFTVPMKSLFVDPEQKTTITSTAVGSSTSGILLPERVPGIIKPGIRRIRVRDLMPRFPTTQNSIEYVKENAFTNAASPVVETNLKPESALTFTIARANVQTVAHGIPASKQILDDMPQLQAYIDQRLMEGLKDQEDTQLLTGDGVGAHLSGLIANSGTYDTSRNVALDTKIDKINHAISQIEDVNLYPSGIILAPRDWRAMQLIKEEPGGVANAGRYLLGGPVGNASPMLWGLPVATSTALSPGSFFVGDFERYTAVWDRMDARVDISTEHSDFFMRNQVMIRAEERLALTVYRNDAVLYGTF